MEIKWKWNGMETTSTSHYSTSYMVMITKHAVHDATRCGVHSEHILGAQRRIFRQQTVSPQALSNRVRDRIKSFITHTNCTSIIHTNLIVDR